MSFALAITLHVLSVVVWVGGMFYAYMAMRPAVGQVVEPAKRPALWANTLERFFRWVWLSIVLILATGFWMIFGVFGGMANIGLHVHLMMGLGLLMMLLYFHVYFAPFRRLKIAVANNAVEEGAKRVGQIRKIVGINLLLGLAVIVIAVMGSRM
ncbi:CopD family protein [Mangrovitalea sediminis]|uniref:CopD family protein n=1 Tax=Mangrovitalea sediminis TaxID=1982043 RepID=UPI000BE4E5CC|nr:CopD family protein [Mangrovitalea sediminis]